MSRKAAGTSAVRAARAQLTLTRLRMAHPSTLSLDALYYILTKARDPERLRLTRAEVNQALDDLAAQGAITLEPQDGHVEIRLADAFVASHCD